MHLINLKKRQTCITVAYISVLTVNIEFMWRGLETGERRAFSESFQPFRAEPHKFYIYRQYTNNVFILQYIKFAKKNVI
jgi:hypothetical protein